MSWSGIIDEWKPKGWNQGDHVFTQFLLTSPENIEHIVDWLEAISPPYIVTVIRLNPDVKGMNIYQIAAAEGQSWGMFLVNDIDLLAFFENGLAAYMDSKMRRPWWHRKVEA